MKRSEEIKNLALSLSKLQGECQNPKKTKTVTVRGTSKGGKAYSYSYAYATLGDCISAIRPSLIKNELCFVQDVSIESVSSADGKTVIPVATCITSLFHASGEWIEFSPYKVTSTDFSPQSLAGAVSYAKRYDLSAIFGLASDEDTDGHAEENAQQPEKSKKPYKIKKEEKAEPKQDHPEELQKARNAIQQLFNDYDVNDFEQRASVKKSEHLGCSLDDCTSLSDMRNYYKIKREKLLAKTRENLEKKMPEKVEEFDKAVELKDWEKCLEIHKDVSNIQKSPSIDEIEAMRMTLKEVAPEQFDEFNKLISLEKYVEASNLVTDASSGVVGEI